jgi:pimeloyl-ACP methyl ester carboxylesterase
MVARIRTGELDVAYERSGQGPALLLLHGAEATKQMFASLVPRLVGRFTVVTYDQRDCGDTEGPDGPTTLLDLAEDAIALLLVLGLPRAHVFGSSFGGRLAQVLAQRAPQVIDRLALASTWHVGESLADINPDAARIRALRLGLPATAEELSRWFFPANVLERRPDLLSLFADARPDSPRAKRRAQTVASPAPASKDVLRTATLLIAGELDRIVPAEATWRLSGLLPNSQRVLLRGVGHVAAVQAPEMLAAELTQFFLSPSLASA